MSQGKENVDKIVGVIKDFSGTYSKIAKAREADSPGGKKITWTEWIGLIPGLIGGIISFFKNLVEIKVEILDYEDEEGVEIANAIKEGFSVDNPYVDEGIQKSLIGIGAMKEAGEAFAQANDWEEQ